MRIKNKSTLIVIVYRLLNIRKKLMEGEPLTKDEQEKLPLYLGLDKFEEEDLEKKIDIALKSAKEILDKELK